MLNRCLMTGFKSLKILLQIICPFSKSSAYQAIVDAEQRTTLMAEWSLNQQENVWQSNT